MHLNLRRIDRRILRSKVGRRTLRLLVFSTLLPVTAVAVIAFGHVSRQLTEQTNQRLHRMSKSTATGVAERLVKVETALRSFAPRFEGPDANSYEHEVRRYLRGLAVVDAGGTMTHVLGDSITPPALSHGQKSHVASGRVAIATTRNEDGVLVYGMVAAGPDDRSVLIGEIEPSFLWGELGGSSPLSNVCILGPSGEVLHATGDATGVTKGFIRADRAGHNGSFEWSNESGEEYLAGYWTVFLKSMYHTPQWTAVLSESRAEALAPMLDFTRTFPFVVVLSIALVLGLSVVHIRRSLGPLEQLQEATEQLAQGDLDARVDVTSGDEFEKLGAAFNAMARRMAGQFNALTTIAEIDRVLLSSLDQKTIIETVLREVPNAFPCEAIMLSLLTDDKPGERTAHIRFGRERFNGVVRLTRPDIEALYDSPEYVIASSDHDPPSYLFPLMMQGVCHCVVLPIFLKGRLSGFVALGYLEAEPLAKNEVARARQLVDQVGVALTNAQLVTELDMLNVGTLAALGRAIDAKSPWTQGHAERVTQMAIKIGRRMGLDKKELGTMHRAGLLHDIGKIAVPQELLDKPGQLTTEEMRIVQEHVRYGGRILEPIPAFREMMPIVMQHHERWDGTGYPAGLAAEEIDLGARIFAVADCYDAISTNRPYRPAMDMGQVLRIIREGSGKAFDPKVVDAFFEVVCEESYPPAPETEKSPVG
jgi:HD-GYP domain-containing protein (c-di-GMP phosphodiesterase class II)